MSLMDALHDWWDSRDLKKIRQRRREKALEYMKKLDKDVDQDMIEDIKEDSENQVIPLFKKMTLKGDFFVSKIKRNYKWGLFLIAVLLFLIFLLFFVLIKSSLFAVKNLEYEFGESAFISSEVLNKSLESVKGKNIFSVSSQQIRDVLSEHFVTLADVEIEKYYPSSLKIIIKEYKPAIIIRQGSSIESEEFLINKAGFVMSSRPYSGPNPEFLTIISTDAEMKGTLGDRILMPEMVDFIYRAATQFEDKVGIKLVSIWYLAREKELHLWTSKNFKVMMTFNRSVDAQLEDMMIALQNAHLDKRPFSYIDLRVENKIFVKPR